MMTGSRSANVGRGLARVGLESGDTLLVFATAPGQVAAYEANYRVGVPVVHALAAFLTMRAFEFIRTDVGIFCRRTDRGSP